MKQLIPILPSKNIPESLEFYQRVYGFAEPWAWTRAMQRVSEFQGFKPEDIIYGGLSAPLTLHFWFSSDQTVLHSSGLRIQVEAIETLYAACQKANCLHPNTGLETKPWGSRQFDSLDPSGVLVTFFQVL